MCLECYWRHLADRNVEWERLKKQKYYGKLSWDVRMIQKSFCPVSPYVTLTLTDCTKPGFLCFPMYNVQSPQRKWAKGSKSLFI